MLVFIYVSIDVSCACLPCGFCGVRPLTDTRTSLAHPSPPQQVKALWPEFDVQVFGSEATKVQELREKGEEIRVS